MKPIKIRRFCYLPRLFNILIIFAIPVSLVFIITGIISQIKALIFTGLLPLLVIAVGLAVFYSFGITVTEKRVTLMYVHIFKTFKYDDIRYIEVCFSRESIWGEIKAKGEKVYEFHFDDIMLSPSSAFHTTVKVRMTRAFVTKCIEELSRCDKVRVQNYIE